MMLRPFCYLLTGRDRYNHSCTIQLTEYTPTSYQAPLNHTLNVHHLENRCNYMIPFQTDVDIKAI